MMIPEIARYRCVTGGAESGRRPSVLWLAGLIRLVVWLAAGNCLVTGLLAQTPQPPVNVSVSPSSGSGMGPQTFAFTSSSVNGSGYINWMGMLINYGVAPGACSFNYAPLSNVIWIVGDDGASYVGTGNLGVAGTIENSQCRLNVGASSVVKSGNNVTVNLALTFKPGRDTVDSFIDTLHGFAGCKFIVWPAESATLRVQHHAPGGFTAAEGCGHWPYSVYDARRVSDN